MEGLIVVLDEKLPPEDIKIINAFREQVESALRTHFLYLSMNRRMDEMLSTLLDSSISIAPLLNWDRLLQTIVEKATQLLKAEQGSLMLFDQESSELRVKAKKSIDEIIENNMRIQKGEGIAGKVFENGTPLLVEDVEKDPRINQKNKPRYKTKSFLSIPLKIEDRLVGVLNISDKISGEVFNENDLRLIQSFATNASIAIERNMLYKKNEELKELSVTDPLTGMLNRRYLNARLNEEIARFNRYKYPFSLLMVDVDEFKKYNDTFGHIAGDKVLKIIAHTIQQSLRSIDKAARFGGDEFVLILPQTPKVDAINIANRIKENVEKIHFPEEEKIPPAELTVSIGLTAFPDDASSAAELLEKTDQALYLAKKGGKNRLVYL
jgi:diguanylate cyclase (GGDEF)-like protein